MSELARVLALELFSLDSGPNSERPRASMPRRPTRELYQLGYVRGAAACFNVASVLQPKMDLQLRHMLRRKHIASMLRRLVTDDGAPPLLSHGSTVRGFNAAPVLRPTMAGRAKRNLGHRGDCCFNAAPVLRPTMGHLRADRILSGCRFNAAPVLRPTMVAGSLAGMDPVQAASMLRRSCDRRWISSRPAKPHTNDQLQCCAGLATDDGSRCGRGR
jgi:hypothetical protein